MLNFICIVVSVCIAYLCYCMNGKKMNWVVHFNLFAGVLNAVIVLAKVTGWL